MKVLSFFLVMLLNANLLISQDKESLEGKKWVLNRLSDGSTFDKTKLMKVPFLIFDKGGKIIGNASCNNIMGTYSLSVKNKIKITAASTRKMCEDMAVENAVTEALQKADNFSISENMLILKNGKKLLAEFEGKSLETTLENNTWNLIELVGRSAEKNSMSGNFFTIYFNEEKKVNGKACNTLIGNYEKGENNGLKIDMQVSTMMSCPDLESEMLFKEALNLVSGYEIINSKELILKNGRVILAKFSLEED